MEELQRLETHQQEMRVQDATQHRDNLVREAIELRNEMMPPAGSPFKASEQHQRYRYFLRLNQESLTAQQILMEETEELLRKRQTLLERSRERKTLERLRERKWTHWKEGSEKEDIMILDEVGLRRRHTTSQDGKAILTSLLLLLCLAAGAACYLVWSNWFTKGDVGYAFLRAPFDRMAGEQVQQEMAAYEDQQRSKREKRAAEILSEPQAEVVGPSEEREGYKKTIQRILQKEEALRRKEEDLDARENSLQQAQDDMKRELTRLNNLQKRVGDQLTELNEVEARRKQEMSAEHKAKLMEMVNAVKGMSPKRAADLLFATAFPEIANNVPPPLPMGQDLEGLDLVVEVLGRIPVKDRAAILDSMTKLSAPKCAILFDRLDNVKTGLEEDRFYPNAPNTQSPPPKS
jgi:flagellar export protein FliJ